MGGDDDVRLQVMYMFQSGADRLGREHGHHEPVCDPVAEQLVPEHAPAAVDHTAALPRHRVCKVDLHLPQGGVARFAVELRTHDLQLAAVLFLHHLAHGRKRDDVPHARLDEGEHDARLPPRRDAAMRREHGGPFFLELDLAGASRAP